MGTPLRKLLRADGSRNGRLFRTNNHLRLEQLEQRRMFAGSDIVPVVPAHSSDPGAPVTIYLDFDGHSETTWAGQGAPAISAGAVIGSVLTGGLAGAVIGGIAANEIAGPPSTPVFSTDCPVKRASSLTVEPQAS